MWHQIKLVFRYYPMTATVVLIVLVLALINMGQAVIGESAHAAPVTSSHRTACGAQAVVGHRTTTWGESQIICADGSRHRS